MISIVIPAFNEERLLPHCLKSLRNQDYEGAYEIIVADNGSTDNTSQVAHSFGVKFVICPRRGTVHAREAGFQVSSGEIIVQADADTVYPPDWLSRMAKHFSSHPEAVAVAGDVIYVDTPLWAKPLQCLRRLVNRLSFRFFGKTPFCLAATFTFRRRAFLEAAGYNTKLPFVGDEHDLLARLSKPGKIVYDYNLLATTSSRRFQGRFWQFLFVDTFYGTILEQAWCRLMGRSLGRTRACPREEYARKLSYLPRCAWSIGMTCCILVGVLTWGYFAPAADVYGKTYDRVASPQKAIALTFDDGPNEPYTSQILDILKSHGVKATFFVVGKNAEYYPDVAHRIVAEGHILGNHSYTHRQFTEFDVPDYSELDRAQQAIYEIVGVKPHLFRPPYGRKTPWELEYVKRKGLVTVTWSVSANDPNTTSPAIVRERILRQARPGAIILLHDGRETKHGWDRSQTVEALPEIIETLQAQGYTFVTVPELLNVTAYNE